MFDAPLCRRDAPSRVPLMGMIYCNVYFCLLLLIFYVSLFGASAAAPVGTNMPCPYVIDASTVTKSTCPSVAKLVALHSFLLFVLIRFKVI